MAVSTFNGRTLGAVLNRPPLWCTLLLCAFILILRRPDVLHAPQFWAEDGTVFFLQARTLGAEALFTPSAGYLHSILRIIAWAGAQIDPTLTPALYIGAAGALTLYVAARTQSARFPLSPSVGYALAVVLVPDAYEVLLNLTNLQWILAGGLMLLLISKEPWKSGQRIHDFVAAVLLGLTGPFVIVLAPLFVWRALNRTTRFNLALAAVIVGCALIQVAMIVHSGHQTTKAPVEPEFLVAIPGVRVGASLLAGGSGVGVPTATALGLATLAGVAWLGWRRGAASSERRFLVIAFMALLVIALYRCRYVLPDLFHGAGSRYFFPLQLLALWLALAAAMTGPKVQSWIIAAGLGAFVLTNFSRWREPALFDYNWPFYAAKIRNGEAVTVRLNPDWEFDVAGSTESPVEARAGASARTRAGVVNISTRSWVTPDKPAMVGFAVADGAPQRFLIRAVGPSLARFGIKPVLERPTLRLLLGSRDVEGFVTGSHLASDPAIVAATQTSRAFELVPGNADAVGLIELGPGLYTVVVSAEHGTSGEVLLEVYTVPACTEEKR